MLRLNPERNLRFLQADKFEVNFAGSEANVAVSLAMLGLKTHFITKLPNHEIGQAAINSLRMHGVVTSGIKQDENRLGIYYVEKGASQRSSKVLYDRKYSSFSLAGKNDFVWEEIFQSAEWFHFSGITPALGEELPEICLEACQIAKKLGIPISCDLNYRKQLWSSKQAKDVMGRLMKYIDICIANEEDVQNVLGIMPEKTNYKYGNIEVDAYKNIAEQLRAKFNLKTIAFTLRESLSADRNLWSGLLYNGEEFVHSKKYDIKIIDRLGAGDSFSAGLIFALLSNYSEEEAIDFAVAASCLKHSIEQDFNLVTFSEIKELIEEGGSGRIKR